jgi:hypothetical protein
MTIYNLNEFVESMRRVILFFVSFFQWIIEFQKIASQEPESVKKQSPKDEYIELQKNKFLLSFQDETHDWNSNIDEIIKDQTQLAEFLKDSKNDLEKKWRTRILIENTPRGNVIMFYDIYKRGFSYYCDQAVMPYDIMNAVAMKYVLKFRCRDFFVDSQVLPPISSDNQEEKKQKPSAPVINNQAFAKFKTYNNATKKAGISTEKYKTINCFLHLGASRNWSPISKKVKPNPLNGFQTDLIPNSSNNKISYLDYKNKMKKDL